VFCFLLFSCLGKAKDSSEAAALAAQNATLLHLNTMLEQRVSYLEAQQQQEVDEHADPRDGTRITVKHMRRGVLTAERDIDVTANMSFGAVCHQAAEVAEELAGLNEEDTAQTDFDTFTFVFTTYGDTPAAASWVGGGVGWDFCGRFSAFSVRFLFLPALRGERLVFCFRRCAFDRCPCFGFCFFLPWKS
jgi:hypothetical protein